MAETYLTPNALAPLLGFTSRTLRRAVVSAGKPGTNGSEDNERRAAALLDHSQTPGNHVRWTRAQAAAVLRAYGRPVPADWNVSETKEESEHGK